ncbi:SDR family oxidoreductase [Streptomyces sp. NPDC059002]|uniref:SDR family oxidoreductase n=1 Tax=Streptomyces sp. NPDC059002 TaxID=3346690 RepID=UPI0036B8699B
MTGVGRTITAAVPYPRASGAGSVVNMTSQARARPGGSSLPYAVVPGMIGTPWFDGVEGVAAAVEAVAERLPLARSGRPESVAEVVVDLGNSSYITGEVLLVDGGGRLLRGVADGRPPVGAGPR